MKYREISFEGRFTDLEITLYNDNSMDIEVEDEYCICVFELKPEQVNELINWYRKSVNELHIGA